MFPSDGMNKMGILWKLRLPEQEISIAEESGPVRTFRCLPALFEKLRKEEVREGCFIEASFCMDKRMIVDVDSVKLTGYVTKWAPKYAFVHTNVLPQIKLMSNNRVAELKFMRNPPSSLSSTYLDPQECDFPLENNMAIRFALIANLKKTTHLRNAPYCDLKAFQVEKITGKDLKAIQVQKVQDKSISRRGSSQSSHAVNDPEARLDTWFNRRMSSPRFQRSPSNGRRTPETRTPEPSRFLDEGFRKRGGSTPVKKNKKHVKRDPSQKRKQPPQSAPVTPAGDMDNPEPELRHLIGRLQSKSRPQSATTTLENPPKTLAMPRCLRCQEEGVDECKHKPPTTHSRTQKEPKGKRAAGDELSLILQDKDAECARLRQVVDDLRLQLSQQQQNSPSNVQPPSLPSFNYSRSRSYKTPSLHDVSYDQAIKNKHYDTIFAHSPSVSPSSSPVPDVFQDPEKFLPFLATGGCPSSTRSDIMLDRVSGTHTSFDPMAHHYGTPLTTHTFDPDESFFDESRSSTTTPSWATNSDQLSARECMDYYEPSTTHGISKSFRSFLPSFDGIENSAFKENASRKSPREISEALYVPPLELTPAKIDGEPRARHHQQKNLPFVNQDLNKADNSRWAPVTSNCPEMKFATPSKMRNYLPSSSKTNMKQSKPVSSFQRWDF